MAVNSVSNAVQNIPSARVNPQLVSAAKDSDGNNDGSHAGEVESKEGGASASASDTVGTKINVTA